MIGQTLQDRYLLEEELGRGGMGVVYRGRDTFLQRPVAVKVVSRSGLGTEGRARLLQEARAAARLDHSNIVAIFDAGDAHLTDQPEPVTYIVMQLVDGRSLVGYQPPEIDSLLAIAVQLCSALMEAHGQGIIHRDLKPANILLSESGTVKLMDFGLARLAGGPGLTQAGTIMGTLAYIAPEVIQGQPAGVAADLYALGITLYELTAGRPPFEGEGPMAILSQHLYAPIVPPSAYNEAVPPQLDLLLIELLRKQPEDRPESAAAVKKRLTRIRDRLTVAQSHMAIPLPELQRLVRGRLVGRQKELAQATAIWQQAATGPMQILLISGEPGIGKTRLARELTTYAEVAGGRVVTASCYPDGNLPYQPLAELARAILASEPDLELPPTLLAELITLAPDLRLSYPDVSVQPPQDPELERNRLYESFVSLVQIFARRQPLLLFIDDLHWADGGSLNLLRHLARRSRDEPLMILATYREVDLSTNRPGQKLLQQLDLAGLSTRLKLGRLDQEQTGNMLETLFNQEITSDFLAAIFRETEGNPFFVEELSRALIASGGVIFDRGRWQRPDVTGLALPQSVRAAIEARLDNLAPELLDVLRLAALLGRNFSFEQLQAVSPEPDERLIDHLERAEQIQLIEEKRDGQMKARPGRPRFSFTHALIHSTLVDGLSTLRRQRLQLQVAQSLEAAFPEQRPELAPLLGRYFAEAGQADKAIDYLLQTGDAARLVYDNDGATEAYEQALVFLREVEDFRGAAQTQMKLGLAYHSLLDFRRSHRAYEEAFSLRQQAGRMIQANHPPAPHPLRLETSALIEPWYDPAETDTADRESFCLHLYSGLVTLDTKGDILPEVAERWEVLDGGRRYRFYLDKDQRWTDGRSVTAGDFVYAWRRALHPDRSGNPANMLYDIRNARDYHTGTIADPAAVGVKALDDWTLEVELEEPSGYFLTILAMGVTRPVPRHVMESLGQDWKESENVVTNGPLVVKSYQPRKSLTLMRNPAYTGRYPGNVNEIVTSEFGRPEAVAKYLAGELDALSLSGLAPDVRRTLIQQRPGELISTPLPCTWLLWFQLNKSPVDDWALRRALVLATDRDTLAAKCTDGLYFPAGGGLYPPGMPGHIPGIALGYDPIEARRILARASVSRDRKRQVLKIVIPKGMLWQLTAEELGRQWREHLDLELDIIRHELSEFPELRGDDIPHIWFLGWCADYPDPDSFLRVATWREVSGWRHDAYDRLIYEARSCPEPDKRQAMYRQLEKILVEEAPVVPLYYTWSHELEAPWVNPLPYQFQRGYLKIDEVVIRPH